MLDVWAAASRSPWVERAHDSGLQEQRSGRSAAPRPAVHALTGAVTETPTTQSDDQALFTAAQIGHEPPADGRVVATLDRQAPPSAPVLAASGRSVPAGRRCASAPERLRQGRLAPRARYGGAPPRYAPDPDQRGSLGSGDGRPDRQHHRRELRPLSGDTALGGRQHRGVLPARPGGGCPEPHQGSRAPDPRLEPARPLRAGEQDPQLTATLAEYNASYSKATTERLAISSQLDRIKLVSRDSQIDRSEIPVHTAALDALRRDLLVSNTALAKAREIYGGSHPKFIQLKSENDEIRRNIREEFINAVESLEIQRAILVGREESLRAALAKGDESPEPEHQARRYSTSEGELKTNRDLYALLTRASTRPRSRVSSRGRPCGSSSPLRSSWGRSRPEDAQCRHRPSPGTPLRHGDRVPAGVSPEDDSYAEGTWTSSFSFLFWASFQRTQSMNRTSRHPHPSDPTAKDGRR